MSELFAVGPAQFSRPRGVAENSFTKPGFGKILSTFPRKKSKTQSSLNLLQSGPWKFTKSDFFGIGPDPVSSDNCLLLAAGSHDMVCKGAVNCQKEIPIELVRVGHLSLDYPYSSASRATCHKRKQKFRFNLWKVALQRLHCNICSFCSAEAVCSKLRCNCNMEKDALQESTAFLPL